MRKIHNFDNGIQVIDDHLLDVQRERYKKRNVHEEDEEDVFVSLINSLPNGATYVNVGTAIGYYPLLAKQLRNDLIIHCFEPLPRHLNYLRDNIALNGWSESDFHIHAFAISTQSGDANFVDHSYGSSLRAPDGHTTKKKKKKKKRSSIQAAKNAFKKLVGSSASSADLTVSTLKLSEIFEEIGSDTIDFLQMDIQGFEEPVLGAFFSEKNLSEGKIVQFLVGTHGADIHAKCKNHLEGRGYQISHDEQETKHQPDGILLGSLISVTPTVE